MTGNPSDDSLAAAGDDYRDVIDRDLIVPNPPADGWRPDPKDVC
jgi:hypothetical protein